MNSVSELRNLNELNRGIHKHWIWGSEDKFSLSCDYLQKINYSIQDLNSEICNLCKPTMKEVVYVIVLVDWICEAVDSIHRILRKEVSCFLNISKEEDIQKAEKYFKAIRSFVVAHPLNTDRHTTLRKQLKLNKGIEERSIKIQEKTDLLYANEYRAKEAEQNRKSQRKERDAR